MALEFKDAKNDAVIVAGVRTPIGAFRGKLSKLTAPQLGGVVIGELIKRTSIEPGIIDEVVMGNVLSAGLGQHPARQAAINGGIPVEVPAFGVNKVCGSGLKAVMLGSQAIRAGDIYISIAGGMESMSRAPYILGNARDGYVLGDGKILDSMVHDGLWDAYHDMHMGCTGDLIAQEYGITREEQDKWALRSNELAVKAIKSGAFKEEIVPVSIAGGSIKKPEIEVVSEDESPREDTTLEKLSKLRPAFTPNGTVTAGNASKINDGAAALLLMSRERAESLGYKPMAVVRAYASAGVEPRRAMAAPIVTVRKLLSRVNGKIEDIDLFEINEAFASQTLAAIKELSIPPEKTNINGGAIALGHPIGASGARILVTLLYAMKSRKVRYGIATLCIGGGNGVAILVENYE